jgi:hypothetical protein
VVDGQARVRRLAVHAMPPSVGPEALLRVTGIDRTWIASSAGDLLEQLPTHDGHRRGHAFALANARLDDRVLVRWRSAPRVCARSEGRATVAPLGHSRPSPRGAATTRSVT